MTGWAWLLLLVVISAVVALGVAEIVRHAVDAEAWGASLPEWDDTPIQDGPYDQDLEQARRIAPAVIVRKAP